MHLKEVYTQWASREDLTPAELDRVLGLALRCGDSRLVSLVLAQASCSASHVELVRSSSDPAVLCAWLRSRRSSEADFAELVSSRPPALVVDVVRGDPGELREPQLRLLWATRDQGLRLEALGRVRWHHRGIPKSWGTWLVSSHRAGRLPLPELHFRRLGENCSGFVWPLVRGDLELMLWVAKGMKNGDLYGHHTDELAAMVDAAVLAAAPGTVPGPPLVEPGLLVDTVNFLLGVLGSGRDGSFRVPGSAEYDLGSRLLAVLVPGSAPHVELSGLLGVEAEGPRSRADLLAVVAAGSVPGVALDAAVATGPGDELWEAVASCGALGAVDALRLVSDLDRWDHAGPLGRLLKGRRPNWRAELAVLLWNAHPNADEVFSSVFRSLPERSIERVLVSVVEGGPRQLKRFVGLHLASGRLLSLVPVGSIVHMEDNVSSALLRLTRSELGDCAASWEIYESLSGEFSGTYGELLATCRSLGDP